MSLMTRPHDRDSLKLERPFCSSTSSNLSISKWRRVRPPVDTNRADHRSAGGGLAVSTSCDLRQRQLRAIAVLRGSLLSFRGHPFPPGRQDRHDRLRSRTRPRRSQILALRILSNAARNDVAIRARKHSSWPSSPPTPAWYLPPPMR